MIPTTVAGLVLFIALLTPGYVWVRATERRVFRPSRSGVLEVAEIVTLGVIFSGAALLLLLSVAEWTGIPLPTAARLARSGGAYLRTNPWASLLSLFALIAVGSGLAALTAWLVHRKSLSSISHASTWQRVFDHGGKTTDTRKVRVSVELRDGRTVEGYVALWDLGDSDQRSIVLQPPISLFTPVDGRQQGERKLVDRVILEGETVAAIWVIYDFEIDGRTRAQRLDIGSFSDPDGN